MQYDRPWMDFLQQDRFKKQVVDNIDINDLYLGNDFNKFDYDVQQAEGEGEYFNEFLTDNLND